jgi:hypothetical protein
MAEDRLSEQIGREQPIGYRVIACSLTLKAETFPIETDLYASTTGHRAGALEGTAVFPSAVACGDFNKTQISTLELECVPRWRHWWREKLSTEQT